MHPSRPHSQRRPSHRNCGRTRRPRRCRRDRAVHAPRARRRRRARGRSRRCSAGRAHGRKGAGTTAKALASLSTQTGTETISASIAAIGTSRQPKRCICRQCPSSASTCPARVSPIPITRERFTFACERSRSATRALILTTVSGWLSESGSCVSATTRVARSVMTPDHPLDHDLQPDRVTATNSRYRAERGGGRSRASCASRSTSRPSAISSAVTKVTAAGLSPTAAVIAARLSGTLVAQLIEHQTPIEGARRALVALEPQVPPLSFIL